MSVSGICSRYKFKLVLLVLLGLYECFGPHGMMKEMIMTSGRFLPAGYGPYNGTVKDKKLPLVTSGLLPGPSNHTAGLLPGPSNHTSDLLPGPSNHTSGLLPEPSNDIAGLLPEPSNDTAALRCIAIHEEAYFDEWVDYHYALGFSNIYVYDNSPMNDLRQQGQQKGGPRDGGAFSRPHTANACLHGLCQKVWQTTLLHGIHGRG